MATLKVTIPDNLDKRLREEIFRSKGMKKGNLTEAIIEAVEIWIRTQRNKKGG